MNYTITIFTPQELNHSSYIQTGLFELENDGLLKTKVKLSLSKRLGTLKIIDGKTIKTLESHPKTSFYELEDINSGKKIKFATDLYDASFTFSTFALEHCDYIFKRNFEKKIIDLLPQKYQDKLVPLGLTFKVKPENRKSSYKFFIALLFLNLIISVKIDKNFLNRIYKSIILQIQHWNNFNKSNSLVHYKEFKTITENTILFQTRCFANEGSEDVKGIHEQRYRIIQMLKKKFPIIFKGGFIPSKVVYENYRDALTNLPTEPLAYLNEIKKAKIVIYTRGLAYSPAWKMAEYLSQGKIIVAEKLTAELPEDLTNGKEVLFFENEEEISILIENVMNNNELSSCLAKNARHYFDKNIHPKENVKRILNFMLQNNTNA